MIPRANLSPNVDQFAQQRDDLSNSARRALAFKREYAVRQRLRRLAEEPPHVLAAESLWHAFRPSPVHQAETRGGRDLAGASGTAPLRDC
jgi:hypothetical protein